MFFTSLSLTIYSQRYCDLTEFNFITQRFNYDNTYKETFAYSIKDNKILFEAKYDRFNNLISYINYDPLLVENDNCTSNVIFSNIYDNNGVLEKRMVNNVKVNDQFEELFEYNSAGNLIKIKRQDEQIALSYEESKVMTIDSYHKKIDIVYNDENMILAFSVCNEKRNCLKTTDYYELEYDSKKRLSKINLDGGLYFNMYMYDTKGRVKTLETYRHGELLASYAYNYLGKYMFVYRNVSNEPQELFVYKTDD